MNKKQFNLIILFLTCASLTFAQGRKVNFQHSTDLNDISAQALENDKLIFIDFYTDWCVPCKKMDNEVFAHDDVADYINQHFISVKINAEKDKGIDLAKQYNVTAYPYFLILDADLSIKAHILGASPAHVFLEKIQVSLDPNRSNDQVQARYNAGERSPQLVNDYAFSLMKEEKEVEGYAVIDDYYSSLTTAERVDPEHWYIFQRYTLRRDHSRIRDLLKEQSLYRRNIGDSTIDSYLERLLRLDLMPIANGNIKPREDQIREMKDFIGTAHLDSDTLQALMAIAEARFVHSDHLQTFKTLEKEFPKIRTGDRFILMLSFKPNKSPDSLAVNAIQEEILSQYIPEQSEYNQKMLNRIYGDLKKLRLKDGVFFQDLNLQEALDLAGKTNKIVFLDAYAVWCGPCKEMDLSVFPLKEVGDVFNQRFVSIKVDAEKGEGIEIRKKYNINAYPTYLYLDEHGNELYRLVGFFPAKELLQKTREGLSQKPFSKLLEDYESKTDRSPHTIEKIVKTYFETGYKGKGEMILDSLFLTLTDSQRMDKDYIFLYRYAQNDRSDRMQFFVKHHTEFENALGWYDFQDLVDALFPQLLMNRQAQFRKAGFLDREFSYLEKFKLNSKSETKVLLQLIRLAEKADMDGILDHLDENIMLYKGRNRVFASYMAISVPNKGTPEQNTKLKGILDRVLEVETDPISIESFTMFRNRINTADQS